MAENELTPAMESRRAARYENFLKPLLKNIAELKSLTLKPSMREECQIDGRVTGHLSPLGPVWVRDVSD